MDSLLKTLTDQYLIDINNTSIQSVNDVMQRSKRIKENYDRIYREVVNRIDNISTGSGNIDGGAADTIYLQSQKIDGGNALNI